MTSEKIKDSLFYACADKKAIPGFRQKFFSSEKTANVFCLASIEPSVQMMIFGNCSAIFKVWLQTRYNPVETSRRGVSTKHTRILAKMAKQFWLERSAEG
jgi:hypothetical protein